MMATTVVLPAMIRLLRILTVNFRVNRTVLKFASVHWIGLIFVGLFSISLLLSRLTLILHDPQYNFTTAQRMALLAGQALTVARSLLWPLLASAAVCAALYLIKKQPVTVGRLLNLWAAFATVQCLLRAVKDGSLDERQRTLIGKAVTGVARGDINLCRDAVMGLGEFHGKTDKRRLYRDIEDLLDKYGSADLGSMDLAQVFEDLSAVMKANGISMPGSLTMLARGLATIEGVVADLSPQINVRSEARRVGKEC